MSDQPAERVTLLYLGVREWERGKPLRHLWYDLTGTDNDGSPLKEDHERYQFYGSKKKGHSTKNIAFASPGQIFTFEKSENGVYGNTAHYVGRWACQDDVVKWQAESSAVDRAAELQERAKKESKDRLDWEALGPFRQAYNGRLNYRQQQMLLAQVIQYITTHRGTGE
jgi:hypothetical protein